MIPAVKTSDASRPAIGSSARAASSAEFTVPPPSVDAETTRTPNITMIPAVMPETTSTRIARISTLSTVRT
jgi:hypothetical protein